MGTNNQVDDIAIWNNEMYIVGTFTSAGGVSANRIAKWNGSSFSALGTGLNSNGNELRVWNNELYVGGAFITAGGNTVNRVAKWNGSSFSALGSGTVGTAGEVFSLEVWNGNLYIGGSFSTAGGVTVNRITKWDGSSFTALGTGTNGNVYDIEVYGDNLYIGGSFSTAGGVTVNRIAKWDGSSFTAMGTGANTTVNNLAVWDNKLYIGGGFTTLGGTTVNYFGSWNGSSFSAISSNGLIGTQSAVTALFSVDDSLYVGGDFFRATDKGVFRAARYGNQNSRIVASSTSSWTSGTWYHLAGTYDGASLKIYVNGSLQSTKSVSGFTLASSGQALKIGRSHTAHSSNGSFDGILDELQIFNSSLDASGVTTIYSTIP